MAEPAFQFSEKLTGSGILVVRGTSYEEFSNNLAEITNDVEFRNDMDKFVQQVTGKSLADHDAVVAQVQQAFAPQAQGGQQAAPQQQGGAGFQPSCPHGARVHKTGVKKNGGTWEAWFCPEKGTQCKPQNADGSYWS